MGLTSGSGPFGAHPAGVFVQLDGGRGVLLWERVAPRLRAFLAGRCVVDTTDARLLHETGHLPVYYVPEDALDAALLEPSATRTHCPRKGEASYRSLRVGDRLVPDAVWAYPDPLPEASFLAGYAALYWDRVDEWFAEDDELFGHARDPYQRIDVYATARRVRILVDGAVVADSVRAKGLFETGLPPRWYLPPEDCRLDLLEPSSTKTRCAYKGSASYWSLRVGERLLEDVAWSYPCPLHDAEPVRGLLCFLAERVDTELGGVLQERPRSQWSHEE